MSSLHADFVLAFNRGDLDGMAALLQPSATAQVLGAPFPEEVGAAVIRETSFPHICGADLDLSASRARIVGGDCVLLRTEGGGGPVDTVLLFTLGDEGIARIEYVVAPHEPERLRRIGASCGIPTLADDA